MTNFAQRMANRATRRVIQIAAVVVLAFGALAFFWAERTVATMIAVVAVALVALGAIKLALISLVESERYPSLNRSRVSSMKSDSGRASNRLDAITDLANDQDSASSEIRKRHQEPGVREIVEGSGGYMERASRMRWFHALDLGGFQTSGRFPPNLPPNFTLFPAIDLVKKLDVAGSECLDIGTASGLMAFGLEAMGGVVTAVDALEKPSSAFQLAHEALESSVTYAHNVPLREAVGEFGMSSFDVVICAGVMYHLLDPVDVVRVPRQLLRHNGYLVLETAFDPSTQSPSMTLNPTATPLVKEPRTYWVPSESAVLAILQLFGFDIVGVRRTQQADRIAVLARSVSASAMVDSVPEQVRRVWDVGFRDPLAAGGAWNPEPAGEARGGGPTKLDPFREEIDMYTYRPAFPPHPEAMVKVVGKTR